MWKNFLTLVTNLVYIVLIIKSLVLDAIYFRILTVVRLSFFKLVGQGFNLKI